MISVPIAPPHLNAPKHHGGQQCRGEGQELERLYKEADLICFKCPICQHLFWFPEGQK